MSAITSLAPRFPLHEPRGPRRVLGLALVVALLLWAATPGCNAHWPDPDGLRTTTSAAIDTYDGVKRMADILKAFKLFDADGNATATEEDEL